MEASIQRNRPGGGTLERMRVFLGGLAETGNVDGCYAALGLSRQSAYALRRRNPSFAREWEAAVRYNADAAARLFEKDDFLRSLVEEGARTESPVSTADKSLSIYGRGTNPLTPVAFVTFVSI